MADTLHSLAATAAEDPDNPWLNNNDPDDPPDSPAAQPEDNDPNVYPDRPDSERPGVAPPSVLLPGAIDPKTGLPAYATNPAAPEKPAARPSGGGSGAPAGPSLARQEASEEEKLDKLREQNTKDIQDSIEHQQDILRSGNETATRIAAARDAADQAGKILSDNHLKHATADANERQRQLDAEAQGIRDTQIDPQKWFKDRGVAGSILAAIAMGAGAFAVGMPHSNVKQNYAMDIVNQGIDRDVDAQKNDINNRWKAVDFKGKENDKTFAHNMFVQEHMDNARVIDYQHASNLIDRTIATTNNQSAIEGMNQMKSQLQDKIVELQRGSVQRRYAVLMKEEAARQAAAAAAAANNPFSNQNMMKAYVKYSDDMAGKGKPAMSYSEFAKSRGGAGSKGQSDAGSSFQAGLNGVDTAGKLAGEATVGDWFLSFLPAGIAPNANMAMQHLDQYNNGIVPAAVRLLGDRVPPESIREQTEAFKIKTTDPQDVVEDKMKRYKDFLITNQATAAGKKSTDTADNGDVPGAVPVGQ